VSIALILELLADGITVIAGVIVVYQLRLLLHQRQLEAFVRNHDTTRELIVLAMDRPELLKLLNGAKLGKNVVGQKYMQLWVNHLYTAYVSNRQGLVSRRQ